MTVSDNVGIVSNSITFNCSSDLDPVRVEWYRNGSLLSETSGTIGEVTLDVVSTDDEGAVYTCSAIGQHGSQERNMTLNVEGDMMLYCIETACHDMCFDYM